LGYTELVLYSNCYVKSTLSKGGQMNIEDGFLIKLIIFLLICVCTISAAQATNQIVNSSTYTLPQNTEVSHIVIKYREGTGIKIRNGHLISQANKLLPPGIDPSKIASDIAVIESIAKTNKFLMKRTFDSVTEDRIDVMRKRGATRLKKQLPDLNLFHNMHLPKGSRYGGVEKILEHLNRIKIVEVAYAQPTPQPANPTNTPNYINDQGYLMVPPSGIDAKFAWTINGGRGQGVNIIDVEGAWRTTHEDMPNLFSDSGNQMDDLGWRNHGTAVLGVIGAIDNGSGISGISNQSSIGVQSINSTTTANAILNAANIVGAGGIVLIELHAPGPDDGSACMCNVDQCNYVAMEFWQANFDAIQVATANGVIVVEAAGNGSADLDSAAYNDAFNRNVRDSGAILVGASLSNKRSPTCWTNFGTRIDVHGWGENVVTMGYGDLFKGDNREEDRFYTAQFSGTSSASPIIVGAAACIQGVAINLGHAPFDSMTMRALLVETGTLQTDDLERNIGPLPNIRTAIESIITPPQNLRLLIQ